ncbi:MAG: lysostaphin resistance A-like protein [Phycisphaerales bacterium JB060]
MDQNSQTFGDAPPIPDPPPMPGLRPDPGSPQKAGIAWLVLLLVLPLVVVMQQMQVHAEPEADASKIAAPRGDDVEVSARMGTRMAYEMPAMAPEFQNQLLETVEGMDTPLQRFRAALASRELVGPERTVKELESIVDALRAGADDHYNLQDEDDQARHAQLLADARTLLPYYRDIAEEGKDAAALDDETLNGLVERHGYFGELVRIARLPADHELRKELLSGATGAFLVLGLTIVIMVLAILAGVVLGITALVMLGTGKIRWAMPRPARGGSVYLETAVLFVVCFALLQAVQALAAQMGEAVQMVVGMLAMPAQWLLLLVPLWPMARGVSWSRIRDDLGLRAPRGVFIEILAGLGGYLATLPIVIAGVVVMLLLLMVQEKLFPGDPDAMAPSNPILELARTLNPILLVMIFTLATVWAPLCEELVFRGALFRHLRSRMALPIAAVLSAMVFGMMHGYAIIQLIPVTILGFNFALIRSWRGSLIGPIAAHALNNAVVLTLLFSLAFVLYG